MPVFKAGKQPLNETGLLNPNPKWPFWVTKKFPSAPVTAQIFNQDMTADSVVVTASLVAAKTIVKRSPPRRWWLRLPCSSR
jgi:hypothetical protein